MFVADRPSPSLPTSSGPTRTCVGCRMRARQSDLVRVVVRSGQVGSREDAVAWLDIHRTFPGRGAYLHPAISCLDLADRRRALPRALRRPAGLDLSELRDQLAEHLRGSPHQESP